MKTKETAKLAVMVICIFIIVACILPNKSVKYEIFKSDKKCITYEPGMQWTGIEDKFGEPDLTPFPTGNNLGQNIRIYKDKYILVHTDRKKIKINEKIRYVEIVNKLEICGQK